MNAERLNPIAADFLKRVAVRWWIVPLCSIIGPALVYAQYEVRSSISGVTVERRYDERELQIIYQWINVNPLRKSSLSIEWITRYIKSSNFSDDRDSRESVSVSIDVAKNLTGYVLSCSGAQPTMCREQLDLVEPIFFAARNEAIRKGLADVRQFLDAELESIRQLQANTTDATQLSGFKLFELDIIAQRAMLDRFVQEGAFLLEFVGETSRPQWEFVQTTSSYLASSLVAGLIGLLIVLQIALNSSRSTRSGRANQPQEEPS